MRLLLVEDNVALADELNRDLKRLGYAIDWLADGRDALHQGLIEPYDLILLDLGLPGISGLDVLQHWRKNDLTTPVLILTARDKWSERIAGLKAGADDYLTKPFHPEELQLRIQALLRRAHGFANQARLQAAGLILDEAQQTAEYEDKVASLTAAEFSLLRYFMLHSGYILSKAQLYDHLYNGEVERDSNVIEVHVNHLRSKLGKHIIETHRGQGYRLGDAP